MSRSFDSFELDNFRDSDWDWSAARNEGGLGRRGSSQSEASCRAKLEKLRDAETSAERVTSRDLERQEADVHSVAARTPRLATPAARDRTKYRHDDRTYTLRESEIHTLSEVGKFRVVAIEDLAKHAYAGDRSCMERDVRNLVHERLIERRNTSAFKKDSQKILTLTEHGKRFLRQNELVPEDQAIYSGLVKPKEVQHDSALYRLYHKAAAGIERKGGKVLHVQLDYELKEELYRKIGKAQANGARETHRLKEILAHQMHLPVSLGKVSLPDLRIEYTDQNMEVSRVDLELATGHYHAGHLAEKARAGFQIYARSEDAANLRRIRDDREIMTAILSL